MQTLDDKLARFWRNALRCQECSTLAPWHKFPPGARGNPRYGVMILGEAPGRVSLEHGRPFSNPRNLTVRNALARAVAPEVIEPEEILYFSDAVKCWPCSPSGANRSPSATETSRCTSNHLTRELEIIRPKVIFAFGVRAASALLGYPIKIAELHGQAIDHPMGCRVIPLMHPSTINIAGIRRVGMRTVADYESHLATLFRRELTEAGIVARDRLAATRRDS
ncbi:MAG TPA: uracil-DNA glycosylase family protein [Candidatus Binataceae bacterium]|nr:uracil-DNA glycosylase family protein [Candidatus Binataceae bacterium]